MRKIILAAVLFCFAVSGSALAQEKIAIVDVQQIILTSKAGQNAAKELRTLAENASKKVQAKETEVKKLAEDINKQKNSLSNSALNDKNIELNKKGVELDRLQKDLQAELQQTEALKLEAVFKELEPVVRDYAIEKKFDVVLLKQPGLILYSKPEVDITKDIITRFDTKWSKQGAK